MPKRRRSDSFQHQLDREHRQREAEAALTGNMRDGAPDHLRGDDRRNFLCPVIRLVRGGARLVRRTIQVADGVAHVDGSNPPTIASMTNRLVVLGAWLVRGDEALEALVNLSDRARDSYGHLVGLVRAEWDAERKASSTTRVRWSQGTERDTEVGRLVAALSGEPVSKHEESYSHPYSYRLHLQKVSRRHAAAATLTANLRGGAPEHLTGDDRRNHLCPPVRLQREIALLVRRMIVAAARARYGYRGEPHTPASMANLLLFVGGWLVFRDEALDELPPGAREPCKTQVESLRATRLLEADLLSQSSTAGARPGPPHAMDESTGANPMDQQVATSAPAAGWGSAGSPVEGAPGIIALEAWAAELRITIEWTYGWMGYLRKYRVLRILIGLHKVDQFAAILMGMAAAAPSIRRLSGVNTRSIAAEMAAEDFAGRLKMSAWFGERTGELRWERPDDDTALRDLVREGADWLSEMFQRLPATALLDLTRAAP